MLETINRLQVGIAVTNKFRWSVLAATVAATVALYTPLADAQQRVISGNDKNLSAENMEVQRSQTLNIKKLPRNPHDDPIPGVKPYGGIEGLTFRLSKVNGVDVSTATGREAAKHYTVKRARTDGFSETREQKTNAEGIAEFRDLGPGLYLIEEFAPDEEHDWRLSSPQLVILPLGDVMGQNFSYDNVLVTKPDPGVTPTTTPKTPPGDPGTPPGTPDTPGEPSTPPGDPGDPADPDDPGTPDSPGGQPGSGKGEHGRNGNDGNLAVTGANVIWAFAAGVALILLGFVLMRRRKQN